MLSAQSTCGAIYFQNRECTEASRVLDFVKIYAYFSNKSVETFIIVSVKVIDMAKIHVRDSILEFNIEV